MIPNTKVIILYFQPLHQKKEFATIEGGESGGESVPGIVNKSWRRAFGRRTNTLSVPPPPPPPRDERACPRASL